jgi:histo-blood group ABO system transferase
MARGLVCIATGRYVRLVGDLVRACSRSGIVDRLFCLTDDPASLQRRASRGGRVEVLYLPWGGLAWPLPTLWRYHAIDLYADLLGASVSHLLYCDVDMRPLGPCDELFGDRLVAVAHPGYWSANPETFPYERDPRSAAFLRGRPGHRYVAGGVQGGPAGPYLSAVAELRRRIQRDHLRGVSAVWHDESHWNRYVADHGHQLTVAGPEFCWPESWPVPAGVAEPRLLALDKDHHGLRGTRPSLRETSRTSLGRVKRGLRSLGARRAV